MDEQEWHGCGHSCTLVDEMETRPIDRDAELWKRVIVEVFLLSPVVGFEPVIDHGLQRVFGHPDVKRSRRVSGSLRQSDEFKLLSGEIQILLRYLGA